MPQGDQRSWTAPIVPWLLAPIVFVSVVVLGTAEVGDLYPSVAVGMYSLETTSDGTPAQT